MKKSFVFAGKGGQGIIFVATLLSQSAILQGLHSIQTQIYTAAQRGDLSKSEVIISDFQVDYPKIDKADYFISLTKKSFLSFKDLIDKETTILFDNTYEDIDENLISKNKIFKYPFTKISFDNFNKSDHTNIIALGLLIKIIGFIKEDSVLKSLERYKKNFEENKIALYLGLKIYEEILEKKEV